MAQVIISTPEWRIDDFNSWLQRNSIWLKEAAQHGEGIAFEIAARRARRPGNMDDNPPIEAIDRLIQTVSDFGASFQSIHLPIHLHGDTSQLGGEISAIDGWTDLASYINIPLLRLTPIELDLTQTDVRGAFNQILGYMAELERKAAISTIDSPIRSEWCDTLESEIREWVGLNLDMEAKDATGSLPVICRRSTSPANPDAALASAAQTASSNTPYAVVELIASH
ncbi:MAG: hypothetical protein GC154_00470 [bacterium]|nr:hypothetical protein [bacterium]